MNIRRLSTQAADFEQALEDLLFWDTSTRGDIPSAVAEILQTVKHDGDRALVDYTARLDGYAAEDMRELTLTEAELSAAVARIPDNVRQALESAAQRIRQYHERQTEASWSFEDEFGNELGQQIMPLQRVGIYVPGGQASYPSTVLMTAIPARVAGVDELIVTTPTPHGERSDVVLAALHIAGVDKVFTIGGAQAVAGLAYGTASVPRVDKIVGPGGAYVAEAKRQVFGHVGIDIIAGPSEVLIVGDGSVPAEWSVLDLFSQAEHDAAAQAILLSPDGSYLDRIEALIAARLPTMARREIIAASLSARGALIQTQDLDEAIALANRIAPEHLELHLSNAERYVSHIRNAGAIFCGAHAGETLGDYVAGPSHVLPTFGTARFASPLGVYDFQKRSSVIRVSAHGASQLANMAVPLATMEGLQAHAEAARVRSQSEADT